MNNRQRRVILYLSQFCLDLDIRYVPGVRNMPADTLSRIFCDMSEERRAEFMPTPNPYDDFVVAVTDDNSGCLGKALQLSAGPVVDENVCWPGAETTPLQSQQQLLQGLNAVTRSHRAQLQQHILWPTQQHNSCRRPNGRRPRSIGWLKM